MTFAGLGITPLTSLQNPRVKAVAALSKPRERQARGVFVVEGAREIDRALSSGYEATELFYLPEQLSNPARAIVDRLSRLPSVERFEVSASVYGKLAMRENSDGLLVVLRAKPHTLEGLKLPERALLLAVEGVEKPGNLGALLRSADGAGVDAVVVLDQTVDLYNQNVIRSSLGTSFHVPVALSTATDFRDFCSQRALKVYAAALSPLSLPYTDLEFRDGSVMLLGSEKDGLSEYWLKEADALIQIPMRGIADSLNVATAGAILIYEALRQRALER